MIELISSVFMLFMFVVWKTSDSINFWLKVIFLALAINLGIEAGAEFGYIVNIGQTNETQS